MPDTPKKILKNPANYNDIIYSETFCAFNGFNNSVSAKIVVRVDPAGIIKIGNETSSGVVPGKIQLFTANDDGKLRRVAEFDKAGRLITSEHWSVTNNPSGNPLLLMLNCDEPGSGATLSLRRSRGTYHQPTSVINKDILFKIAWVAHDGQSYKESSSISAKIDDEVSLGYIPSSIIFKTFDRTTRTPSDSLKINPDKSISVHSLSSLNPDKNILLNSPLTLNNVENEKMRDTLIPNPEPGTLIYLINLDTVQVFTRHKGWKNLF